MTGSVERVRCVLRGETPERPPLYELLRNDSVINHFSGETLTLENADEVVFAAYEPAVDATRPAIGLPHREETERLADGRERRHFRWTAWTAHVQYQSSREYEEAKRPVIDSDPESWDESRQRSLEKYLSDIEDQRRRLGEVFLFPGGQKVGLMGIISEVGLEAFSYYLVDCRDVIDGLLEYKTRCAIAFIERLPQNHGIEAVFSGDDIAYKTGPLLSPRWFTEHYFPRAARIYEAYHRRGIKILFHSDGNLNPLMDGLVDAGIDGLNPIEVLAGMDVGDLHKRYPKLFFAGAIDVSQLLPFGKPQEVRAAVRRSVADAEGQILVGSSTELQDVVPLENYLALRDTCLEMLL